MKFSPLAHLLALGFIFLACTANATVASQPSSSLPADSAPTPRANIAASDEPQPGTNLEVTTALVRGSGQDQAAQELLLSRVQSTSIVVESIDHVATVQGPDSSINLFHYRSGDTFCHVALGEGSVSEGCSSNDQMAVGPPFLRRPSERSGSFHVWVSNASTGAEFFVVVTGDGNQSVSNVINGTGYVIADEGETPVEAQLLSADGTILWTGEIRT